MKRIIIPILAMIFLAGCEATSNTTTSTGNLTKQLTAKKWVLKEMNNIAIATDNRQPDILFTSITAVTGNGGCNQYGGRYLISGIDQINFSNIYSTKMACDNMNAETTYFQLLEKATRFAIQGDRLQLFNGSEEVLEYIGVAK